LALLITISKPICIPVSSAIITDVDIMPHALDGMMMFLNNSQIYKKLELFLTVGTTYWLRLEQKQSPALC